MSETPDPGTPDPRTPPPPIELPSAVRDDYRKHSYDDGSEDKGRYEEDEGYGQPYLTGPDDPVQAEAAPLTGLRGPGRRQAEEAGGAAGYPGPGTVREWDRAPREEATQPGPEAGLSSPSAIYPGLGEDAVKIGLWGSPQSGKTTYLAALRHATSSGNTEFGSWNIYPRNDVSRELLVNFTHKLVYEHQFPEATGLGVTVPLQWMFVGDLTRSRFNRRRLLRRGPVESRFELDLIDVGGGAFAHDPAKAGAPAEVASAALEHLAAAQGLIYLFDPIREKEESDSSTYVNRTIAELLQRFAARGGRAERYLPHQVSVCVTKFDHPEIFQQARRMNLVNFGPDGIPRVLDEHAEQFFDELCAGTFWSERYEQGQASAQFVRDQFRTVFHPGRIRYFVMSSIGFWVPPGWDPAASRFNPEDFANYHEREDGRPSIRGAINPINVLEPLISLQQRLTGRG